MAILQIVLMLISGLSLDRGTDPRVRAPKRRHAIEQPTGQIIPGTPVFGPPY